MRGNKTYRHDSNPEEKLFHDEFIKQHGNKDMSMIVFPPKDNGLEPSIHLTETEESKKQMMQELIEKGILSP